MHLELAQWCLEHAALAAPAVARLLRRYPHDFIYGAVSPDIFLSKKRAGYLFHCHQWSMGKLLLSEAGTDRLRAAVYGYLVHLAADVVAHGYYIPYKIVRSFKARLLGHTYWEMRFDLSVSSQTWAVIPALVQGDFREFDHLLERVLRKTLFSFRTSKRIFATILVMHRLQQLRRGLQVYGRRSRWSLQAERVNHFRRLVERSVIDFLRAPEAAPCLLGDPTGMSREHEAVLQWRLLRRAWRRREKSEAEIEHFLQRCDRRLYEAVYQPMVEWPTW